MVFTLNVNDTVWVQLTSEGVAHLRMLFKKLYENVTSSARAVRVEDSMKQFTGKDELMVGDWVNFQVHELMFYFGDTMFVGNTSQMFINNDIWLVKP